ncbi:MAG: stage III sporulation protein AF [Firmicutes bacterium]|nr:stage III sporulation protein AF [Bacillota bacterium]
MSPWLLSIVGVTIIGVLAELLLTDSPMSKFVRGIYGFFILLVIIQPLPGFFRGDIEIGGGVDYNWELIGTINTQNAAATQTRMENTLRLAGFDNVLVTVVHDRNASSFQIENLFINATGVIIREDREHINTKEEIIRIVTTTLRVDESIIFYIG